MGATTNATMNQPEVVPERGMSPVHLPESIPGRNPKDSMKSTWMYWDKSKWSYYHKLVDILDVYPAIPGVEPPVHSKTDKVPHLSQWSQHAFILTFAWIPFALQQIWVWAFGPMHPAGIVFLYTNVYTFVLVQEVRMLRRLGYKHGFLDGDVHGRDGIPDVGVGRVFWSLYKTVGGRLAVFTYFAYNRNVQPVDVLSDWKWLAWTWFEIGVYGIVLDFYFYVYHRCMHDVKGLWKFHRTHHLTKHPNAALAAYASDAQEVCDMVIIPLLTYVTMQALGLKLGFYEWWLCQQYIIYTEVWGHSGVRVHLTAASTFGWFLQKLGLDLAVEDHDIHHRKGYRKSFNYGKQTKIWDTLFGTVHERIESYDANIDYVNQAHMPIF